MKSLLFSILISFTNLAFADNRCLLVIPFPPGGASEINARSIQAGNNNIEIEYKPGAYGNSAINYMVQSKNAMMLSPAMMYSVNNPVKDLDITMNRILFGSSVKIVTTKKEINLTDLKHKTLRIGIHNKGSQFEAFAKEIKNKNPNIIIVITGSDVKALPMLMNGDLDVYFSTGPNIDNWTRMFDNIKVIGEIPFNEAIKIDDISLKNLSFAAIYTKKLLDEQEEKIINQCLDQAVVSNKFKSYIEKNNIPYIQVDKKSSKDLLDEYKEYLKTYGL